MTRGGGDFGDDGHNKGDDDDGGHDGRGGVAACDVVEELQEGEGGGTVQQGGDVGHGEAEGEDGQIAEAGVEAGAP